MGLNHDGNVLFQVIGHDLIQRNFWRPRPVVFEIKQSNGEFKRNQKPRGNEGESAMTQRNKPEAVELTRRVAPPTTSERIDTIASIALDAGRRRDGFDRSPSKSTGEASATRR